MRCILSREEKNIFTRLEQRLSFLDWFCPCLLSGRKCPGTLHHKKASHLLSLDNVNGECAKEIIPPSSDGDNVMGQVH
jgi:hypothetical protein